MKHLSLILFILIVIAAAGCSKKESGEKPGVTVTKDEMKTKNVDVQESKLSDEFPKDVPIYKDAKVITSTKTSKELITSFEIKDKGRSVAEFYLQEMKKSGYTGDKENNNMMKDNTGIITFQKEGRLVSFVYNYKEESGKTMLTISVR